MIPGIALLRRVSFESNVVLAANQALECRFVTDRNGQMLVVCSEYPPQGGSSQSGLLQVFLRRHDCRCLNKELCRSLLGFNKAALY